MSESPSPPSPRGSRRRAGGGCRPGPRRGPDGGPADGRAPPPRCRRAWRWSATTGGRAATAQTPLVPPASSSPAAAEPKTREPVSLRRPWAVVIAVAVLLVGIGAGVGIGAAVWSGTSAPTRFPSGRFSFPAGASRPRARVASPAVGSRAAASAGPAAAASPAAVLGRRHHSEPQRRLPRGPVRRRQLLGQRHDRRPERRPIRARGLRRQLGHGDIGVGDNSEGEDVRAARRSPSRCPPRPPSPVSPAARSAT